jgi:uncharacterized protein
MYKCSFLNSDNVYYYDNNKNILYKNNKKMKVKIKNKETNNGYIIRITLGRSCNLSCAYCIQSETRNNIQNELSIDEFIFYLKRFFGKKRLNRVEFWGGDPLVYFDKLKQLHKRFIEEFNVKEFWFATNGKLLTNEATDFLIENKIEISISYDGNGQVLRGYDLENDKIVVNNLKRLNDKNLLCFIPTITKYNYDPSLYYEKVKELMETDNFNVYSQLLRIVDKNGYENRIHEELLLDMFEKMYNGFVDGKYNNVFQSKVFSLIERFNQVKNTPFTYPCYAFLNNRLFIDFAGNIMSCGTFNKGDKCGDADLCLGNIKETKLTKKIKDIHYPTIEERKTRLHCNDCLVKHMCSSGCALDDSKEYEVANCKENFYYNLALFSIALTMITGKVVKEITRE